MARGGHTYRTTLSTVEHILRGGRAGSSRHCSKPDRLRRDGHARALTRMRLCAKTEPRADTCFYSCRAEPRLEPLGVLGLQPTAHVFSPGGPEITIAFTPVPSRRFLAKPSHSPRVARASVWAPNPKGDSLRLPSATICVSCAGVAPPGGSIAASHPSPPPQAGACSSCRPSASRRNPLHEAPWPCTPGWHACVVHL